MNQLTPTASRIALSRAKYIGPHNVRLLLDAIGDVEALISDPNIIRRHFPHTKQRIITELARPTLLDEAKRIDEWCQREGVRTYFVGDADYPTRLAECPDAPTLLYVKGRYDHWHEPLSLSVVGTRNITPYGQTMTNDLLTGLATQDKRTLIVSGLAYGVDILAHRKALALGMPTVAVLAHGFDRIYPAVHRTTALEILEQGAWVSEYPPGTNPDRFNFVARNRIIAGLSDATLVVEAGIKSGSLITAELAASYDREVFAVPGRTTDRYSEGCNKLIADLKGILVTSASDITRALGIDLSPGVVQQELPLEIALPIDDPILKLIAEHQPIQINELIQRTGLSMSEVSARLFDLELDDHIQMMPGGLYALARR